MCYQDQTQAVTSVFGIRKDNYSTPLTLVSHHEELQKTIQITVPALELEDASLLAFPKQHVRIPDDTCRADLKHAWDLLAFLKLEIICYDDICEQGFHLSGCKESPRTVTNEYRRVTVSGI